MTWQRRLRAISVLAILAGLLLSLGGPSLYALIAWDRLFRVDPRRHRRRIAAWQAFFSDAALRIVTMLMGISIRFDLSEPLAMEGPFLIVCNHLGGFDGFIVLRVLRLLDGNVDLRAVGKQEVSSWPVVGRAWRELGWGFVARTHDPDDYLAVERCGKSAVDDGANALIFPEGTIFTGANGREGYVKVLPPKSGGFSVLRRIMPERPVLSITICWDRQTHGLSLFQGGIPYGRVVLVHVRTADVQEDDEGRWLREEWRRKDSLIASR